MSVWRIKDVDGATRAQAQAAADKAGIPLAAWVERAIMRRINRSSATPAALPDEAGRDVEPTLPISDEMQNALAAAQGRRRSGKKTRRPRKASTKAAAVAAIGDTVPRIEPDSTPDIASDAGPSATPPPDHAIDAALPDQFDTSPVPSPAMNEQSDSVADLADPASVTTRPREILLAHATPQRPRSNGRPARAGASLLTLGLGLVGIATVGAAGYFLFLADNGDADNAPDSSPPSLASTAPPPAPAASPAPAPTAPPVAATPAPTLAPSPTPTPVGATPVPPAAPAPTAAPAPEIATAPPRDIPAPIPGVQPSFLTGWQDASPAAAAATAPPPPPPPDALQNVGQPELVKRAKAGDVQAQIELGKRYMQGTNNTTTDPSEALRWLLMAAEAGDAQAQFNVGVMYERGIGTTADLAKAAQWYRKAADRPIPEPTALHNLALLYIKGGGGLAADPAQARALMTRAAEMGQAQSQYSLALMYFQGVGGASDPVTALSWVALAARTNNPQYVQAAQELAGALNAEQKNKAQQLANQHVTRINETIARLRALAGGGAPGTPAAAPSPAPAASPPMPDTTPDTAPDKSSTADAADKPLDNAGIAEMQKLLIQLKFYSGKVDGKSGPKTAQAIREYQKMAGLPVDGKATIGLLGSLRDVAGAVTSH